MSVDYVEIRYFYYVNVFISYNKTLKPALNKYIIIF
jgi:hypothetical protein